MTNIINLPTYEQVESVKETVLNVNAYNYKTFIVPGVYEFIVPEKVNFVRLTAFAGGGGGGGGGRSTNNSTSNMRGGTAGGNGMSCFRLPIGVTPGEKIIVTIGDGGVGGAESKVSTGNGADGESGGATSFGDYLTLRGGNGGYGGEGTPTGTMATNTPGALQIREYSRKVNGEILLLEAPVFNANDIIKENFPTMIVRSLGSSNNSTVNPLEGSLKYTNVDYITRFLSVRGIAGMVLGEGGRSGMGNTSSPSAGLKGSSGSMLIEWGEE